MHVNIVELGTCIRRKLAVSLAFIENIALSLFDTVHGNNWYVFQTINVSESRILTTDIDRSIFWIRFIPNKGKFYNSAYYTVVFFLHT